MKHTNISKVLVFLLFALPIAAGAQNINFPDANFKAALLANGIDTDGDNEISIAEAEVVTSEIDVSYKNIRDLTGIEYFINITDLDCFSNKLKKLDISNNTALTRLSCDQNQLTSLDVSNNTSLTVLSCGSNPLNSLDVSNNIALDHLNCYKNKLKVLDVSKNISLTKLYCYENELTSLDLKSNKNLTLFNCGINYLTSLDLSNNTALKILYCYDNELTSLNVINSKDITRLLCNGNMLTSLDLSNNTALIDLYCYDNELTSLFLGDAAPSGNLHYYENLFPFSTLFPIRSISNYIYYSNKKIFNELSESVGFVVDYSSELEFNGKVTEFNWFNSDDNTLIDNTSIKDLGNGQFKFLKSGNYYCQMTNTNFFRVKLSTNNIEILGFIVNFKDWNNTLLKKETVDYGSSAIAPEVGTRAGYTFTGWDVAFDKITSDLTVTAQYIPIEYTITYNNMEGAVNNVGNLKKFTIESAAITLKEATKEGCAFVGWYTNAEFTGEVVDEIPSGAIGDIELWAKFEKPTHIKTVKKVDIKVNPNPATEGYFVVESKTGNGSVTVYSLNGNAVLSQIITQTTQTIEIPELPNGIYLVKVETKNGITTKRLAVR